MFAINCEISVETCGVITCLTRWGSADAHPELRVQLLDLRFARPGRFAAAREDIGHPFHRLSLPGADLVRMRLMFRGKLLDCLVAAQGLKRDLRLKLIRK